jgi:hypothetical protein
MREFDFDSKEGCFTEKDSNANGKYLDDYKNYLGIVNTLKSI